MWQCEVLQHQLKTGVCPALYCTGHCCTAAVREIAGISAARCPVLGDCRTDVFQFNVWWYSSVWGLVSVLSGYRLTKVLYYTASNVFSKILSYIWHLRGVRGHFDYFLVSYFHNVTVGHVWCAVWNILSRQIFIVFNCVRWIVKTVNISLLVSFKVPIYNKVNRGKNWCEI